MALFFFFSSRRRHTRFDCDWSSDVCSSDLSYFVCEFSLESAALFNPSIVPHPDQFDLPPGALRFILSLRATGEGHISSITDRKSTRLNSSHSQISHAVFCLQKKLSERRNAT